MTIRPPTISTKKICPMCGGTGLTFITVPDDLSGGTMICPMCGGTGEIKVKPIEEATKNGTRTV